MNPFQEVKSSQIAAIAHDPISNTLAVRFHSGHVYHYRDVTAEQFRAFLTAESVGKHFAEHFRDNDAHPFIKAE